MDSWEIAGYDRGGDWMNPEKGDPAATEYDLLHSDTMVVRFTDSDGINFYYEVDSNFESWEDFADYLDDMYGDYAGEAA